MSNLNPFVPKGSLLEQQSQSRSRLKLAVFCVVAVGTLGLVAMLIQGCKRDTGNTDNPLPTLTDSNAVPPMPTMTDSNAPINPPIAEGSNQPPIYVPPVSSNQPPILPPQNNNVLPVVDVPPVTGGTEYLVVSGDTLGKIAKKKHVTLKDLEAANPGVDSKHLKVKQKLVIPAGGSATSAAPSVATDATADSGSVTTYTVKSGDVLYKVAKKFGVSVKSIQAANHLSTTSIKVGQKLKIPAKAHKATTPVEPPTAPVTPEVTPTTPPTAPAAPAPVLNTQPTH